MLKLLIKILKKVGGRDYQDSVIDEANKVINHMVH
jgi:hypothetical protein